MGWGVHDYPGPPPERRPTPICPVCGNECETVYIGLNGEVEYCDVCKDKYIWERDAYEWWEDEHAV